MRIRIKELKEFKKYVRFIKEFSSSVDVRVDKKGIHIISMDCANVCMTIMDYKASVKGESVFNLEVSKFYRYLLCMNSDTLEIRHEGEWLVMSNDKQRLKMKVNNYTNDDHKIPDLEYYNDEVEVDSKELYRSIKNVDRLGILRYYLEIDDDKFYCKGVNDADNDEYSGVYAEYLKDVKGAKDDYASYSTEYTIKALQRFKVLSDTVNVEFRNLYPLTMNFCNEKGMVKWVIAPRGYRDDTFEEIEW